MAPGPAAADDARFFEARVRPVLVEQCFACHSASSKPLMGRLRMDSREGLLKGGARGAAIVPGDAEKSLLIRVVRHTEGNLRMPPSGKLSERQIADLVTWIQRGAVWPTTDRSVRAVGSVRFAAKSRSAATHWAFRAPVTPPLPKVKDERWVRSPIDRFVLARLEAKGLRPAPPAARRALIRRATFDLTGLPPTPSEVTAFLADRSPDAFAKVVDRLLASPRYGERWGRHWLDVARYSDFNGLDENLAYASAFRYRDYVIDAFNRDLPYDQFVMEQIAGDLLAPRALDALERRAGGAPTHSSAPPGAPLIATGFLSLGAKMLAEDDPMKMEMDIVDEQVDTVSRAFMGLTVGCARCHDHKFDPVSAADYYAIAGIFKSTKTMENFNVVAAWHEYNLAPPEEQERAKAYEKRIEAARKAVEERRKSLKEEADKDPELRQMRRALRELERSRPVLPMAMGVTEGKVTDLKVHLRGNYLTLGDEAPRRFLSVLVGSKQPPLSKATSGRLELARWIAQPSHPLTSRVMVNRLWRWHFGKGIVASVDNFGQLGDRPTHPELLDWLARRFVNGGWSVKAMHRLLMLSSAYQMSTAYDARAAAVDPENRLYWRMNRRRLEVEAIRDGILATSGQLDTTMGGTLLKFKSRDYVTSTAGRDEAEFEPVRRSVYLPVIRSALYDVFQALDFGDPSVLNGDRTTTTVAPQALFMMNSSLVLKQTRAWATALLAEPIDDAARVRLAYEKALGRPPANKEIERALAFVRRSQATWAPHLTEVAERRLRGWQSLCRVLIASNEFVYLE